MKKMTMKRSTKNIREKRIENQQTKETILKLQKQGKTIVNKSLKVEEDIAKKIKLGGALINKSQGDFIAILVRDFFEKYKAQELGKIIEDINDGKIKTIK